MDALVIAGFLAVVTNRLVDGFVKPIFDKYNLDHFWLMYIAWAVGGALVYLSGVNLFVEYLPTAMVGQVLTAVVAGGGANILNDVFGMKIGVG